MDLGVFRVTDVSIFAAARSMCAACAHGARRISLAQNAQAVQCRRAGDFRTAQRESRGRPHMVIAKPCIAQPSPDRAPAAARHGEYVAS
jgi:hypothetical protein